MSYRPYNQLKTSGVSDERVNNTGVTITKGTPVRANSSGELDFVNVSVEAESISAIGVVTEDITNTNSGEFINAGKISDISTLASFGDPVYVSKSGGLTATKPSLGVDGFVSGDLVIYVGIVAKNEDNPVLKDLIVNLQVIGQL